MPPAGVTLDEAARAEVRRRSDAARDAETRTRYQMVLLAGAEAPVPEIAAVVGRSPATVWRVLQRYRAQGPAGVPRRPRPGSRGRIPATWEAELRRVADRDPREVGVPSANWTTRLLADYLAAATGHRCHLETGRVHLRAAGYVCKRPGWTRQRKAQEQPDWG